MTATPDPDLTIRDQGWTLYAYYGDQYIGSAARQCVGGSRGQSWYWDIHVQGTDSDAGRKPEARAELLRLARQAIAARRDLKEATP